MTTNPSIYDGKNSVLDLKDPTTLDRLAFASLRKIGLGPGEALLLTVRDISEFLVRPWVSDQSRKHFKQYLADDVEPSNRDQHDLKLYRARKELSWFCLVQSLNRDVYAIQVETENAPRSTRRSTSY